MKNKAQLIAKNLLNLHRNKLKDKVMLIDGKFLKWQSIPDDSVEQQFCGCQGKFTCPAHTYKPDSVECKCHWLPVGHKHDINYGCKLSQPDKSYKPAYNKPYVGKKAKIQHIKSDKKECKHEPEIKEVTDEGFTYHVNGDVCVKCQQLLAEPDKKELGWKFIKDCELCQIGDKKHPLHIPVEPKQDWEKGLDKRWRR